MKRFSLNPGRALALAGLLLSLLFSGCAPRGSLELNDALVARLRNRGPVVLSSDNPFLVGNLILTREIARSSVLKGFIEHRTSPRALEVTKSLFSPVVFHLYYPESNQYYTFEETFDDGIVEGPFVTPPETVELLAALLKNKEPTVTASPTPARATLSPTPQSSSTPPAKSVAATPTPAPTAKPEVAFVSPTTKSVSDAPTTVVPTTVIPTIVTDEDRLRPIVEKHRAHVAETTPRGDIVHYVTIQGETLESVARWYTYDRGNAQRIARINGLTESKGLQIGDSIVIPTYLVRNKVRFNEEALSSLSAPIPSAIASKEVSLPEGQSPVSKNGG